MRRLPILTFHGLERAPGAIFFPPDLFRRGLGLLREKGWRCLDLAEAARLLKLAHPVPGGTFVLTFDDGFHSVYTEAFPVLQELGMTATVFLSTGRKTSSGDGRLPSLSGRAMLSWEEIRAMHRAGIRFGAHTMTHPDLTLLSADGIEDEIIGSKRIIEDALSTAVESFAYPFGRFDDRSRAVADEHFSCACTDRLGLAAPGDDTAVLARLDAYYLRAPWSFGLLPTRFLSAYVMARAVPRSIRRSLEGRRP
jgi:peptidoglycan/xylan/chitin deacetylase (PgdA/CDA1 family)